MTSKWINEVYKEWATPDSSWFEINQMLEKVDKVLKKAMNSTDDENLHDKIYELINGKPMLTTDNYGEFEDTK